MSNRPRNVRIFNIVTWAGVGIVDGNIAAQCAVFSVTSTSVGLYLSQWRLVMKGVCR